MHGKLFVVFALTLPLLGCSIQQQIEHVNKRLNAPLCVVNNPGVRSGVLDSVLLTLSSREVNYRLVHNRSAAQACDWALTYDARWSVDLGSYMSSAAIQVYRGGRPAGHAIYDASNGRGHPDKYVQVQPKIVELVDELFSRVNINKADPVQRSRKAVPQDL
ncbi:MAG: Sbal_3080 family lipoprotein [Pseudomonas profundi]|uniref:Sbal_3080 family lipoprotein n=1 Tax=Pseudomonas profundi TaxID=1981513 RepID=UPI00300384A9